MKKILLIILAAFLCVQISMAQEAELKDGPVDFTVNLQSNHLWRGLVITDKPVRLYSNYRVIHTKFNFVKVSLLNAER